MPPRQVRRTDMRPNYARRPVPGRAPRRQIPEVRPGWIRLSAIGVGVLLLLVLLAQATKFKAVKVEGTRTLDTGHVQRVAEEGLSKQWFGRNMVLINTAALSDYIKRSEPGVKQAKVEKKGFHTIQVKITERQPSINWTTGHIQYLLDGEGTIISESKGPYVRLVNVNDSNNLPVKVGDRVVPSAFVKFIQEIGTQLPTMGLKIQTISVPETTSEVTVTTDKGYSLKLDTTRPAAGEMEDLKKVLGELSRSRKAPTQYIDLRIENRAYFK